MQSRLEANLPGISGGTNELGGQLPAFVLDPFSKAMSQAILLPAFVILVGVVAVFFLKRHDHAKATAWQASAIKAEPATEQA
jgi:hypothetical protein